MYTLSLFLLALFSLFIGLCSFVRWDASWLRNLDRIPAQILIILAVTILLCGGLLLLYRFLQKLNQKQLKRLSLLCILILAAGQLFLLFSLRPMLRYDALKTFDMAVEMLQTKTISPTYEAGYFARYTNNYPITILTYWILLLLSGLGVPQTSFMLAVQLLNVACLTGSVWLGYLILKELKKPHIGTFYLLICVLCPLSYVWAGFYYTTTLSIPCLMGILYLYLRLGKSQFPLHRLVLGGILGVLLILGYKLRATTMIAFIALLLAAILKLWKLRGQALKQTLKAHSVSAAAFLLAALLSMGFWNAAVERYVPFDYKNTGFPMIHWVAMGSRWDGAFDQSDELYTSGFETKEEKIAANKEVLTERIREAGPGGLISLAGRKLLNTWADGTDAYQAENSYCTYSRLQQYLIGNQSGFLTIYSQAFRVLQMLTIGIAAVFALLRLWHKKEKPELFLLQLTLLGGMAFYLIWESNPLYSITFTFLGLMLMADHFAALVDSASAVPILKKSWICCAVACTILLVFLVLGKKELVETPIEKQHYCLNQYQYAGDFDGYVTDYEQSYVQTFTTDKPFNRISIQAVNTVGPYNQSAFLVKVTREDGAVIYDNPRFLSGMVVKNTPYAFILPELVIPEGPTTYTLEIVPGYIEGENSLEFYSYTTGNCDMYPGGSLSIAGQEQKNGDLAFAVYEYEVTTYFSIKLYLILCAGILLLSGGITVLMWKKRQNW